MDVSAGRGQVSAPLAGLRRYRAESGAHKIYGKRL